MRKTNFLEMVERSTNPDLEEQHRKNKYPEICSAECPNITCGFRTEENFGKPCQMRFEQYRTQEKDSLPQTIPNTSYSEEIERAVTKAVEPFEARLKARENQDKQSTIERSFTFNGKRTRIDIGTNQERIQN